MDPAHIVIFAGLAIGLVYGAIGLVSGFCLMGSLRGWWAKGDSRLPRTYALAMGIGVLATQLLAAYGFVDLGKSIYLQPTFSVPLMFFGGLLFGYGMVLSNGCGSRALVLLGKGNLRSFVVVIVLGIVTATGGGVLRDLLAARVPMLLRSEINATAAGAGALVAWWLESHSAGFAGVGALVTTAGLRLIGTALNLHLPIPGPEMSDATRD